MPQIQIGPEFFRQEARNYSNIPLAFSRELLQNAVDAGAKRIEVAVRSDRGGTDVVFTDDGTGMSREVLEDVFFKLGATTKSGSGTTGGFGRARTLVCLSQRGYEIRTRDMLVRGSGASYKIEDGLPEVAGCQFRIQVAWSELDMSPDELLNAFRSYLGMSQLSAQVTIGGYPWADWTCRRQITRRISFGAVHVNKSGEHRYKLIARVNGMMMFTRYINAPVQVVLEIDPAKSRDVLLSNRDSLRSANQEELDRFVQEVSTDSLSACRDNKPVEKHVLAGQPRTFVPRKSPLAVPQIDISNSEANDVARARTYGSVQVNREMDMVKGRDPILDGLVLVNKFTDCRLRRASRLFHPNAWGDVHGTKRKKLLLQWITACEFALESFCRRSNLNGIAWRPGFVIDPEMQACNQEQADGSYALLINPVECREGNELNVGNILFKLREWDSHARLVALAAHEVTHCDSECRIHNERFAALYTDIMADCAAMLPEIHRVMMAVA